jgi:hypothetical protein
MIFVESKLIVASKRSVRLSPAVSHPALIKRAEIMWVSHLKNHHSPAPSRALCVSHGDVEPEHGRNERASLLRRD